MKDIFVDIVDEQDEVVVARPLSYVVEMGLLKQIRMVKLFIMNHSQEILICRNALAKKGQDLFDCPLTAIVHFGETYEEALIRAVHEVFGFDISEMSYYSMGKLSVQDGMESFVEVFELTFDALPDFSATRFTDFVWEKPLDLLKQFAKSHEGEKTLSICLQHFYLDGAHNQDY